MQRYMPNIMRLYVGDVTKEEIICFEHPAGNKTIVLTGDVRFDCTVPETITEYNNEQIYFNMSTLSFHNCIIHPAEFKFLLKQCKNAYSFGTKFTKPVLYSEIWFLLRPCMKIYLDIENLIFDDKMPDMLRQFPQNTPKEWKVFNMTLCTNFILPIIEIFIASPVGAYFHMIFRPDDSDLSCENMVNVAEKKFLDAGYVVDKGSTPPDMPRTIVFEKVSNEIRIYFGD